MVENYLANSGTDIFYQRIFYPTPQEVKNMIEALIGMFGVLVFVLVMFYIDHRRHAHPH